VPLVSVLLAVHDDARFLREAIDSVLRQTVDDIELIVIDDASTDDTPSILSAVDDRRLVVLGNVEQLGLAASLNRGLGEARGRYIARLDADDVALASRLELQLERIRAKPRLAVLGSGIVELDDEGRLGRTHRLPQGATAVRWHALFSSPFFHPTVLVDREVLEDHGLRYDPSYAESEDYDLWTRLFAFADGDNFAEPLVLKRVHSGQASQRRGDLQTSFQRQVALREIAGTAPDLSAEAAELAWGLGSGRGVPRDESVDRAGAALLDLLAAFEHRHGIDADVREAAARALSRGRLLGPMRKLAPWLPVQVVVERVRRPLSDRRIRKRAAVAVPRKRGALRVTAVSPEPTPYRSPLFDRVASKDEIDLTVIYAARTVADRPWAVEPRHRSVFLRGLSVPGARRLLRHDYPATPGVARALRHSRPDVVVVSGWSTFAAQAAIAWSRAHRIPYVLHVESHDLDPRSGWRRAVKGAIAPRVVRGAASVLVVGTAARESVIARGARPERVRVFANTVDVSVWLERADRLAAERAEGRTLRGLTDEDVVVQCVARLVPEKGLDTLVRAVGEAGDERFHLNIAGDGPEREALIELSGKLEVRLLVQGDLPEEALAKRYVEADVFALLSRHEPWGVVVNEAAASGLPLVLSDRVGASRDLLRDGENGFVVPADDVGAAAAALRRLAAEPGLRRALGARSRELVRRWGYEPSVESFVAAVREATAR
jgi:glycosyltransferase involved in cell wall biosynthesis